MAFRPAGGSNAGPLAPNGRPYETVLRKATVSLLPTYLRCNAAFPYAAAPRRILTKPSQGVDNDGRDNANSDLIVAVGDAFISTLGTRYEVLDLLGHGTFGQVFKCRCEESGQLVAVKVIKNQAAYYHQARVEIGVLQLLNTRADPEDRHHIVRMKDFFLFQHHLCLAFELLSLNLYELMKHNKFRGLSLSLVRVFVSQILDALTVLRDSRIIHCDLKPENVLVKSCESGEVKVIDFGSACFESRTVYSYIQSRFYRSPEVVLGVPYTMAIDMWSLGCVAAELFLGLPLFPGACEHDLVCRLVATLGLPPDAMLAAGRNSDKYFAAVEGGGAGAGAGLHAGGGGRPRYRLRGRDEYEALTGQSAPVGKTYFQHTALGDIVGAYPFRSGLSYEDVRRERRAREAFTDFLLGVLDPDPTTRWTPRQAAQHPFVTGEQFQGPFQPAADLASAPPAKELSLSPAPVGTPMTIPTAQHRPRAGLLDGALAGGGGGGGGGGGVASMPTGSPWLPPALDPAAGAAAAAAMVASSPQAHMQAHVAAMAAVQAQMSLHQQQAELAGGGAAAAALDGYDAAHSLQRILPSAVAAAMAASYGAPPAGPPSSLPGGGTAMLSPPSRAFGVHLRYADLQSAFGSLDGGRGAGAHGVLPLLQTPLGTSAPFSPMSFQPSSVRTYQAVLALSQQAAAQQAQAAQAAQAAQLQRARADGLGGGAPGRADGAMTGLLPGGGGGLLHASQRAQAAQFAEPPPLSPMSGMVGWPGAAVQDGRYAAAPAALGGGADSRGPKDLPGSRWMSLDGSTEGTPPVAGVLGGSVAEAESTGVAPDWDPLWSDDLLREDEPSRAQADGSGAAALQQQLQQQQQAGGGPPWYAWRPQQQQEQQQLAGLPAANGGAAAAAAAAIWAAAWEGQQPSSSSHVPSLQPGFHQPGPHYQQKQPVSALGTPPGGSLWLPGVGAELQQHPLLHATQQHGRRHPPAPHDTRPP